MVFYEFNEGIPKQKILTLEYKKRNGRDVAVLHEQKELIKYKGMSEYCQDALNCYERAKDLGDIRAYRRLAYKYYYGEGVKKSVEKANSYFKEMCALDDILYKNNNLVNSCSEWGDVTDFHNPASFLKERCMRSNSHFKGDCYRLGELQEYYFSKYNLYIGLKPLSNEHALFYFKKACNLGHVQSCEKAYKNER
ncbi:SEL1-like repeat protein [Helicobacter cetorum]|uniref:SEL1-like repeat protein n=1 Tax=Helicobacter cetorum TaxID=138563 RepID=UPI0013153590|nr:SEL1-like repeat protein [Helicobacter cetorum]